MSDQRMTMKELVNQRLHAMFVQIAEEIAAGKLKLNLTEEEVAAVAPVALFRAEQVLRSAFGRFVSGGEMLPEE